MPTDILYLIAEVSIATVALSGITLVLAVSNTKMTIVRTKLIAVQLRLASLVTAASMLPLVLLNYELQTEMLWRISTGFYIVAIVGVSIMNVGISTLELKLPKLLLSIAGVSAIVLLPFNLWEGSAWPYVTQLFIGWCISLNLFLVIIHETLSRKSEDKDGT